MTDVPASSSAPRYLVCNCERTMELDGAKLAADLGLEGPVKVHSSLCRQELEDYGSALASGEQVVLACTQEAPLFSELADEQGKMAPHFVNIRERAGWCRNKTGAQSKIAALLADATYETAPTGLLPVTSNGVCLVYGAGQAALDVAEKLASRLSVSLILTDAEDVIPPSTVQVPIYRGKISGLRGSLGRFEVMVDGYAPALPSSKDKLEFVMARDGAASKCDLVFDMTGGQALVSDPDRRDGYLRADPSRPAEVAEAMLAASDLIGEFEKPLYVGYNADICAHGRNQQVGCNNCGSVCPTGAIASAGDIVDVDAGICGGCGSCASVCPSGAISYRYPQANDIVARVQNMISVYTKAGGTEPVILFHDSSHGADLIAACARFGGGLPVNVLPVGLYSVTQIGHDSLLGCLAAGAAHVMLLANPKLADELLPLRQELELSGRLVEGLGLGGLSARFSIIEANEPDAFEEALNADKGDAPLVAPQSFSVLGTKREVARAALAKLREVASEQPDMIALTDHAPYGRISINTEGCTLCLACVSCCPANALADNPDQPQVAFTEAACVQCGLCAKTCPERVIALEPRFNFQTEAMTPVVLNQEEPFECVECGRPFGVKSTVEAVVAKLQGNNPMFQSEDRVRLIKMCDDCRIQQMAGDENPMASNARPAVRTTEDYLKAEAEAKATGKKPEDFLS